MNHRLLFLVLVAHGQAMPGPKKAQSVICHAVISSLMYGMLKHVLLSSLCKNNYLGVGIPDYTCLSKRACHFTHKFVSLPFLTHTTYIRFFFWPSSRHSSLSQQKRRRREEREERKERREKKGEENKMRQSISSRQKDTSVKVAGREGLCRAL